jgi:hypothetical protein
MSGGVSVCSASKGVAPIIPPRETQGPKARGKRKPKEQNKHVKTMGMVSLLKPARREKEKTSKRVCMCMYASTTTKHETSASLPKPQTTSQKKGTKRG